ncbi:hypothetical protein SLS62_005247 [Diatrype stigma]|uniref:Uncharacterized protein n=1 Tax=Diatrype stigma TaxID=117547 RepID=A0AAN9UV18_9PEZI
MPNQYPSGTPGGGSADFDPYGHLKEETLARLNEDLRQAELSFAPRFEEAESIKDPVEKKNKVDNLQNSFSTKQSLIRKKYGVRLRQRRTKAEITGERHRLGLKHGSPSDVEGRSYTSYKRQRTSQGPYSVGSHIASSPSSLTGTPSKHLAVSAMNSGLGGSSATAATTDPTRPSSSLQQSPAVRPLIEHVPPQNSLSSYQRKGYRVSSHVPRPSQPSPTSATATQSPPDQRHGSASAPVVLDDDDDNSSDSDSDSDEEIPASLPSGAKRTSGTPQTSLVVG